MRILGKETFYPTRAIEFLKQEPRDGNLFSWYGWGGYLIWQYPEKKVFVDGRMPSLKWTAPEGELSSAFETYNIMFKDKSYEIVLESFDVRYVLLPQAAITESQSNAIDRFLNSILDTKIEIQKEHFTEENGWKLIYQDDQSRVLEKTTN